jgi:hypothetical protein
MTWRDRISLPSRRENVAVTPSSNALRPKGLPPEYGDPMRAFSPDTFRAMVSFAMAVILGVLAAALFVGLVLHQVPPPVTESMGLRLCAGLVAVSVVAVLIGAATWKHWVYVCSQGVTRLQRGEANGYLWAELGGIELTVGETRRTETDRLTLRPKVGRDIIIRRNDVRDFRGLTDVLREQCQARNLDWRETRMPTST